MGRNIQATHKRLQTEILSLQQRFPGKVAIDVKSDKTLQRLLVHAEQLKNPEAAVSDRCTAGELGRELEKLVRDLTAAVTVAGPKVARERPIPTRRASFPGLLMWVNAVGSLIRGVGKLSLRVAMILLIIVIGPLVYLFLTMEEPGTYEKEIELSRQHIQEQRKTITSLERKREELEKRISSMSEPDTTRQEKIEIMELVVQVHTIDEKRNKMEVDIADHEERMKSNRENIDEVGKKSFLKRLFKF